jgi:hypothetical protein
MLKKSLDEGPWPAPGSADTELGVLMEPEVSYGKAEVYTQFKLEPARLIKKSGASRVPKPRPISVCVGRSCAVG